MIVIMENNIIFITRKSDWREESICIKEEDFNEETMTKIDIDEEELRRINEVFNKSSIFIDIIYKDNDKHKTIKKELFDPRKMLIDYKTKEQLEKLEFNLKDMIESKRAPGLLTSRKSDPSITHKGKIDDGAVADYLDTTLDGAKKRAVERQTKFGSSFRKNELNKTKIRKKKSKKRRR